MSSETRQRIVAASLKLFAQKGIAATTTRDIATEAGIAEGTIYRHFPSKEAMADEIFLENYLPFARVLDSIQRRNTTTLAKIVAMVNHFYGAFDRDRDAFTYLLVSPHRVTERVPHGTATPVSVLRDVLSEGIAAGTLRPLDVQLGTHLVLGLITQPANAHVYHEIEGSLLDLAPTVIDAIWRVVCAD
ncbi:TetR/AcrR family transcriptional regulator [Oleomonas cavernae]|uniref:TetR/AcrR family transcriptional regulator n=1 Tax=Oleomonas cavernae TaxID=2320859 RepID=A0A418WG25_9PROT|nr:TetR/AcrR family transcriptional regulator [Oleomonas cavernae]RJF88984.1 TetR/AcrR family transcriptional regulator [Oleomonas cavernae]